MKSIFEYTDYRKFLSDFYKKKKASDKKYSHRFIARQVGFKSDGHFSQILSGRANISISFIERLAEFCRLNKREFPFFQNMVLFNQAKSHEDKKKYFEKMMAFKESSVRIVNEWQYEFYDKWYYAAVRELLSFYPFTDDYGKLGQMLIPAISATEAKQAVELLDRLQLIRRDDSGRYVVTDAMLSTGQDARSVCINNFVFNILELAKSAVDRFEKTDRNLSWVSLSVSPQGYESIVEELRAFRTRIMHIASSDPQPDRAYMFNFQVFPLSRRFNRDERGDL